MPRKRNPETADRSEDHEKTVPLPTLTHLQFLVLDILSDSTLGISSQKAQESLAIQGQNHRGPKFYQLMKRLEDAGLVESWQQDFDVAGTDVYRTFYKITGSGKVAWRITLQFYATRIKASKHVFDYDSE